MTVTRWTPWIPHAALAVVLGLGLIGCGTSESPELVSARAGVLLREKPEQPLSIEAAKSALESETGLATIPVTLIGQIDAGDFDPFEPDRAALMLSELPDEAHGADGNHDASTCPFCKRKAASAPKAYVVLLDGDQTPISMPASTLLAVSKGDRLIVQGNGRWDEAMNTVHVEATKVYVVR